MAAAALQTRHHDSTLLHSCCELLEARWLSGILVLEVEGSRAELRLVERSKDEQVALEKDNFVAYTVRLLSTGTVPADPMMENDVCFVDMLVAHSCHRLAKPGLSPL